LWLVAVAELVMPTVAVLVVLVVLERVLLYLLRLEQNIRLR
jgi:hypothetical protein